MLRSIAVSLSIGLWLSAPAGAAETARIEFGRDVRPILESSCWKCHGDRKQRGGLRLDRRAAALARSESVV